MTISITIKNATQKLIITAFSLTTVGISTLTIAIEIVTESVKTQNIEALHTK